LTTEEIARLVREAWMLPKGPVPNMVELLESNGGIVIPCDFGTDLIDALSQRIEGLPILFFVNVAAPADRLRHTLAHELGHMVLHTVTVKSDEEMENEADAFAGAFLLPADEIRPQLRRFDLRQLANLKLHWKVSMAALAMRADQLKLITPYQSKMFWIEMSKLGYRKREPNEPPKETPSLLRQMISFHTKKLGYSLSEMAKLLHLRAAEFQEMYRAEIVGEFAISSGERTHLRLIK
jgi:Zn-dependent peptidase ImmA (M78 family)